MNTEERAARASRLRQQFQDADFNDAYLERDADIIAAWRASRTTEERENLWHAQNELGLLRSKLSTWSQADISALRRAK
jgi:hypothetical protein